MNPLLPHTCLWVRVGRRPVSSCTVSWLAQSDSIPDDNFQAGEKIASSKLVRASANQVEVRIYRELGSGRDLEGSSNLYLVIGSKYLEPGC